MRRLPGPQVTARATEATLEALFGLFRDWQRTQTQSSATAPKSLRQQMDVRFCMAGTNRREALLAPGSILIGLKCALSRARKENSCFSVDK
jgi:hypothetical protein